jgi:DeoR/GlpR family transcriptional regulator of sugar metabolism
MDVWGTIFLSLLTLIIGSVASYFITRWSMKRQKIEGHESNLRDAANQIISSADNIIKTKDMISIHDSILNEILGLIKEKNESVNEQTSQKFLCNPLSRNPQLDVRIERNMTEKKLVGKFIVPHISTDSRLAIDCGTNAAWAFYEIAEIHKNYLNNGSIKVVTNNIFVPLIFSQDYGSQTDDTWRVKEIPSSCFITSGNYFPSYGAILKTEDDNIDYYNSIWQEHKPNIIFIGCTSFDAEHGPYCRSDANRNFKNSLFQYAVKNENTKVFILLDVDKIGKRLGVACNVELWEQMKERENIFIISGYTGNQDRFIQLPNSLKVSIEEEVQKMRNQGRKNPFLIIDESTNSIDLYAIFN